MTKIVKYESSGDSQVIKDYHLDLFDQELDKYQSFNHFCIDRGIADWDDYRGGIQIKLLLKNPKNERLVDPITGLRCVGTLYNIYTELWTQSEIRHAKRRSHANYIAKDYQEEVDKNKEVKSRVSEIGDWLRRLDTSEIHRV